MKNLVIMRFNFWMALFIVHSSYLPRLFAVDIIKTDNTYEKDASAKIELEDIYKQLWYKVQSDANCSFVQTLISKYKHLLDLNKKNLQGKTLLHIAVQGNAIAVVEYLLSLKDTENKLLVNLDVEDSKNEMALQYAFREKNKEIVNRLINAGASLNPSMKNGGNILHWIAITVKNRKFKVSDWDFLIKKCQQENVMIDQKDQEGNTPFMLAIHYRREEFAIALRKAQASLSVVNNLHQTALHLAVNKIRTNKTIIEFLINQFQQENLNVNPLDINGNTPFMLAINNSSKIAVDILIKAGAPSALPIHWVAQHIKKKSVLEDLSLISKLIQFKKILQSTVAAIDEQDEYGNTPLIVAIMNENQAVAEALIAAGAKLDIMNVDGKDAFNIATEHLKNKKSTFLQALVEKIGQAKPVINENEKTGRTSLDDVFQNDASEKIIPEVLSVKDKDIIYKQLWDKAQSDENCSFVQTLINKYKYSLDLNKKNLQGKTLLHIAVQGNAIAIVEFLLSLKDSKRIKLNSGEHTDNALLVCLDAEDNNSETALQYALKKGNSEIVKQLMDAGASLHQSMKNGANILHWIARNVAHRGFNISYWDLFIQKCRRKNLAIDEKDQEGNTPFMLAIHYRREEFANALKKAEASLSATNNLHQNSLHLAVNKPIIHKRIVELVIKKFQQENLDINTPDINGNTPFMLAINNRVQFAVDALIKAGAPSALPMHWVAQHIKDKRVFENFDLIGKFIKFKQETQATITAIDEQDEFGNTPLIVAIMNENEAVAEALIAAGAKLNIMNADGKDALNIARAHLKNKKNVFLQALVEKFGQAELAIDAKKNQDGNTPLMVAHMNHNPVAVAVFPKPHLSNSSETAIDNLIQAGASSILPIHWVAEYIKNKIVLVKLDLISKFIKSKQQTQPMVIAVDEQDESGNTPLIVAVMNRNQAVAEALIQAGAKLNIMNATGETALHIAAAHLKNKEDENFLQFLIEKFRQAELAIDTKNQDGHTPLTVAKMNKNKIAAEVFTQANLNNNGEEAVENLKKVAVELRLPTINLRNILHWAAREVVNKISLNDLIEKVKQVGLSLNEVDQYTETPLMIAVRHGNRAAAEALVEADADMRILNIRGQNVLHVAAFYLKDKTFLEFLTDTFKNKNLDIHVVDQHGNTPFNIAVLNQNRVAAEVLMCN